MVRRGGDDVCFLGPSPYHKERAHLFMRSENMNDRHYCIAAGRWVCAQHPSEGEVIFRTDSSLRYAAFRMTNGSNDAVGITLW